MRALPAPPISKTLQAQNQTSTDELPSSIEVQTTRNDGSVNGKTINGNDDDDDAATRGYLATCGRTETVSAPSSSSAALHLMLSASSSILKHTRLTPDAGRA